MDYQQDTVVGVFLDQERAQQAIDDLNNAGYSARVADKSAIQSFRSVGFEDEVARLYESRYNQGNTLVVADARDNGQDALGIMMRDGAQYINLHEGQVGETRQAYTGTAGNEQGQAGVRNADYYRNQDANQRQYAVRDENVDRTGAGEEQRMTLREETLTPVKEAEQTGEVRAHKVVREQEQQVPVRLTREEVYIERNPVDRPATEGEVSDMRDEVIRVPVYEEQAELQKQARVREEVTLGKRATQEQETLTGTTRREDIELEKSGDVQIDGDTQGVDTTRSTGRWEEISPTYRSRWEQRYGSSGARWQDVEPGYRYAWEMRNNPQYRGQDWRTAEPNLRRDWERRYPQTPWDKIANTIRQAWDDLTS